MYLPGKKYKYISYLLIGAIFVSTIAGALFGAPVVVYAWSVGGLKGTIASLIISLLLQTGVAPTNPSFLNSINSAYGVESSIGTIENMISNGLLSESGGQLVDTGLSQAIQSEAAWAEWGLNEIFETTVSDVGVRAGSGAVNLANQAINLGTGGTIGAFAGAAAIGVGVGVLANHVRQYVSDIVKYGFPMSFKQKQDLFNNIPSGYGRSYYVVRKTGTTEYTNIQFVASDVQCVGKRNGDHGFTSQYYNKQGIATVTHYDIGYINKTINNQGQYTNSSGVSMGNQTSNILIDTNVNPILANDTEVQQYIANYRNDENEGSGKIFAPDLIGDEGNLEYDNENDDIPEIRNIVPEGHDMNPVDMDDYQDYVDQANDNTENDDTGEETQGQDFQDFVNPYFAPIPQEPIIPDTPVGPEQPEMPVRPTPAPEEIQDVLNLTPTANLKDKFPFCIPFDIYDLITGLEADREAPVITCPVDNNGNSVTVDLSEYDSAAELLRLLELILFIIGLAVATRYLIGATGGG